MSDDSTPVIGFPTPPPAAVVVAVADRFAPAVRLARGRQLLTSAAVLVAVLAAACAAVAAGASADAARPAAVAVGFAVGVALVAGALVRPRPLEVGTGLLARGAKGGLAPLASARGALVLLPTAVRETLEGLFYGAGIVRHDPAADLAAWIVLALAPPHGAGAGAWASIEGVSAAGLHELPDELKPALGALVRQGWVSVDRGRYPPRVRLENAGLEFARTLGSGVG